MIFNFNKWWNLLFISCKLIKIKGIVFFIDCEKIWWIIKIDIFFFLILNDFIFGKIKGIFV